MSLQLPESRREAFTGVALLCAAGLLALTRSLWSLLLVVPLILAIYAMMCNEERLIAFVTGRMDFVAAKVDELNDGGPDTNPDVVLVRKLLDVFVGRLVDSGSIVGINLGVATHTAIYAQSGGGKTTILYALLYDIISLYAPGRVRVAICDPKVYSFSIFGRIPHLFAPIGRGVAESLLLLRKVDVELARRERLFARLPEDRLCENIRDYHRIVYELGLDLPPVSWLIFVVDEVQEVATNEEATEILTRLAKKGRALGIRLILATQRPTTAGLPHEIQSQLECKFVGFMDSSQEYSVARAPPEVYSDMVEQPGRFMLRYKGRWQHIDVERVPVKQLETMLRKVSHGRNRLEWSETDARYNVEGTTTIVGAGLSETQKGRRIVAWMVSRGSKEKPGAEEFMAEFGVSQATAYRKIPAYWPKALAQLQSLGEEGGE